MSDTKRDVGVILRKKYYQRIRELDKLRRTMLERQEAINKEYEEVCMILLSVKKIREETQLERAGWVKEKTRSIVLGNFVLALTSITNPKNVLENVELCLADFEPETVTEVGKIELIMKMYEEVKEKMK